MHWNSSDYLESLINRRFPGFSLEISHLVARDFRAEPGYRVSSEVVEQIIHQHSPLDLTDNDAGQGNIEDSVDHFAAVQEWATAASTYERHLDTLSLAEISKIFHEGRIATSSTKARREAEGFWNDHSYKADLARWMDMPLWKPAQAVALADGKDPRKVNTRSLTASGPSSYRTEFLWRVEQVKRAIKASALPKAFSPAEFVVWAQKARFPLSEELIQRFPDTSLSSATIDLDADKRGSISKALLGLAILHYDLDPDYNPKTGSTAFAKMSSDLESVGIGVSHDVLGRRIRGVLERMRATPEFDRLKAALRSRQSSSMRPEVKRR